MTKPKPRQTDKSEVMPILSPILGDDLAAAIIEHRDIIIRIPLTATAARLQAREYLATGNPTDAAEMQILRGWRAMKSSWYANEKAKEQRSTSRRSNDMADFTAELMDRYNERLHSAISH